MNIKEMEENGTIDYYLELKKYIDSFINRNYPLSQDDMRSILDKNPSQNVVRRQEIQQILNEAMEEALKDISDKNTQMLNGANNGEFTEYSAQDFQRDIFDIKQKMLEKLWMAQQEIQGQQIDKEPQEGTQQEGTQQEGYQQEEPEHIQDNSNVAPLNVQNINEEANAPQINVTPETYDDMER